MMSTGQCVTMHSSGKILLVDDNADARDLLCKLLRVSGYEVLVAVDGNFGFSACLSFLPDLIITDISMPELDGIGFIRKVRKQAGVAETPILVVTAHGARMVDEAERAGANDGLEKPFDFQKLLGAIEALVPRARDSSPAAVQSFEQLG